MRNISTGNVEFIRGLSALVLVGEDQDPAKAYEYWTAGGEVHLAQPSSRINGSFAYYRSARKPKEPEGGRRGRGSVGFLTVGGWWPTEKDKTKLARKLDFRFGFGSGDDPATASHDEGYIGETAGRFTGDTFFLSSVAGLIDDPAIPNNTSAKIDTLATGLRNKAFAGIVLTDKTFSPLAGIASLLHIGDKVINQSTAIKLHTFRFDERLEGGREAGAEIGVDFDIEVPTGIVTKVGLSYFFPGDALETVLDEDPWAITSSVTVKIQ